MYRMSLKERIRNSMGVGDNGHAEWVIEVFRKKDDDEKGKKTLTGRCAYCGKRIADREIVKTNRIFKIWQFIVGKIRTKSTVSKVS